MLLQTLCTIGVEVHLCLLKVQTRGTAYAITLKHYAQTLLGEFHGIVEVTHANLLLDEVVVLCGESGHIVLYGKSCACCTLPFQFL